MKTKLLILLSVLILNHLIVIDLNAQEDDAVEEMSNVTLPADCFETDCFLCYLTRFFDEEIAQELINEFSLVDGSWAGVMSNNEKGISVIASGDIGLIEFQTEEYKGYLPLIGAAQTSKSSIMERYPNHQDNYDHLKFIYESLIMVDVYFSDDRSFIRSVQYSPLDFIKFYDDCFTAGLASQIPHNENAIYKLSLITYLENLFVLSGDGFQNLDPAQLGYFADGKTKDNIFAIKLYEGLDQQGIDYTFNELKSVIEKVDFDVKIILSSVEQKLKIDEQTKTLICELTGISSINADEFSYSRPVYSTLDLYAHYEKNSFNLLIHPVDDGKFDLILVIVNK